MTSNRLIFFSVLLLAVLLVALLGDNLAPHDPYLVDMKLSLQKPCSDYSLGCDNLGRCILSRLLYGAKATIFSAVAVVIIVFSIGTLIGTVAALKGGIADKILMKINVIFQAFPSFVLAMAIAGILGAGLRNGIISICIVQWTKYARMARSYTLEIRNREYLQSATISGAGAFSIIVHHVLPNIFPKMLIMATMDVSSVVLSLAGLSFLGLSAKHPTAEWGLMMSDSRMYLQTAPWTVFFSGVALFVVVLIFNLFAESLRDVMDVKGQKI
ncbi:MAG: ABC transporter permease [Syntrophomonadaceae bacterium]|nr:ABC transporter permease [Syntrophomonadaceae bacterium]